MLMGVQLSGIQLESGLWYLVVLGFFFSNTVRVRVDWSVFQKHLSRRY